MSLGYASAVARNDPRRARNVEGHARNVELVRLKPIFRRFVWFTAGLVAVLLIAVIGGGFYFRHQMRASLPIMEGSVALAGLQAVVEIERDALGVPTITASSRADLARGLGFLHAQDRFFQMDLQRRQAAGELSALVGARAIEADTAMRVHRFRAIARQALARTVPEYRAVLEAYAQGVNAGLSALGEKPVEYLLLRMDPEPWRAEDSLLTGLAMFNTLQGRQAGFEATFGTLADTLPPAVYEFLTARGSEWDAPIVGNRLPRPAIPGPEIFDLRNGETARTDRPRLPGPDSWPIADLTDDEAAGLGSNNWAVAGSHTASGAALIANDMHLAINVPNIWYRASMVVSGSEPQRLSGVTLPGVPNLIVGSNGHVAWGFTNTGGDWSDLVVVESDPRDPDRYMSPDGPIAIDRFSETIAVAGGEPTTIEVRWTRWGPIVRRDHRGRDVAQRWVAHDAQVLSADVTALERVQTLDDVFRVAASLGIPGQNIVAGDRSGRVGWTIAGPIPRREGFDGSRPTSWADGSRRWNGYLAPDSYPRVSDPTAGRVWTANSAVVDGERLATIGEGGYADGIRARIIRDRLLKIDKATEADMLSIQLDNSALFHLRWRELLLEILTPAVVHGDSKRAEFRQLVETTWTGRAEPGSVAYRLVRTFRQVLNREVFEAITEPVKRLAADFDYARALRSEGPLWQLITERPSHLLNPKYASWDAQLIGAVDAAITELTDSNRLLTERTWGEFNRASVTHPLASAIPLFGRWMNMPADALPGDVYTPRAHSPRTGPSERMVVAPGREHEGILHMPTGQSGHPLSPHYGDQHRAWVTGEATPFLPGPAVSKLTLAPGR